MPRKNRQDLRDVAPELFEIAPTPWATGEWETIPIDIGTLEPTAFEAELEGYLGQFQVSVASDQSVVTDEGGLSWDPRLRDRVTSGLHLPGPFTSYSERPGAPWYALGSFPTPEAFAFYLPFHRYAEPAWGIYITPEGVLFFAAEIARRTRVLSFSQLIVVARLFLYFHEFFHHVVESFATRLETDRREPLYNRAFERLYRAQWARGDVDEEALANGYALQRVKAAIARAWSPRERREALSALIDIVSRMTYGYGRGAALVDPAAFVYERCEFAERNYAEYDGRRPKLPAIWLSADNMFRGLENVKTQASYLVPFGAPLHARRRAGGLAAV